jgi:hypothetical protein
VSLKNTIFVDASGGSVTIGGFAGGVAGQVLRIVRTETANDVILEHNEGGATQAIFLSAEADETLSTYGGWDLMCDGTSWREVDQPAGSSSGSSAHTYMIDTGDWGGDQVGAGSLGSGTNNVVWAGYSTANATNSENSGDAWYSSQIVLNDKYYFKTFTFERDTSLALESLWIGVRSSATSPLTNKVNLQIDDTVSIFATNNLCSSSAGVWNWYGPYETSTDLPASWTNTLPTWVNGTRTNFGLNVRADVFTSHSNSIQLKVESRINTP